MNVSIDEEELADTYLSSRRLVARAYSAEKDSGHFFSSVFYEDQKMIDAKKLIKSYLSNDLLSKEGPIRGEVHLNVVYYDYDFNETFGIVFNVLTLGAGFIIGVPTYKSQSVIELAMEIFNTEGNLVASFRGVGEKRTYRGLYYRKIDERDAHMMAMKRAFQNLNERVMNDYDRIAELLH